MKAKLIRIKEKLSIIKHVLRGGQYAFFAINDDYVDGITTRNKAACYISDNADTTFLGAVVAFTEEEINEINELNNAE